MHVDRPMPRKRFSVDLPAMVAVVVSIPVLFALPYSMNRVSESPAVDLCTHSVVAPPVSGIRVSFSWAMESSLAFRIEMYSYVGTAIRVVLGGNYSGRVSVSAVSRSRVICASIRIGTINCPV